MVQQPAPQRPYLSKRRRQFLNGVREYGTIASGAKAAQMTRREALGLVQSVPGFKELYEEALADFHELMEERALRMADDGDGSTLRFKLRGEFPQKYGPQPARSPTPPLAGSAAGGEGSSDELDPVVVWDMFERLAAQHEAAMKRNAPTPN